MSLGLGTAVTGAIYNIYDMILMKIKARLYCSVRIKMDDDIFDWINRYMQDKGMIREGIALRAWVKPVHLREDPAKEEMDYMAGYGNHLVTHNG